MDGLRDYLPYSNEELNFIKSNYLKLSSRIISIKLDRTKSAIDKKKRVMGLYTGHIRKDQYIIIAAQKEKRNMIELHRKVNEMKQLIELASNEFSLLKKAQYIAKLKKLSGLT